MLEFWKVKDLGLQRMASGGPGRIFWSWRVLALSQLGTRYMGKQLLSSFLAGNELVPRTTKNTTSGRVSEGGGSLVWLGKVRFVLFVIWLWSTVSPLC